MSSRNNTHLTQPNQRGADSVARTHSRRSPVSLLVRAVILIGYLVIWLAERELEGIAADRLGKHDQIRQLKDKLEKLGRWEIWEKS